MDYSDCTCMRFSRAIKMDSSPDDIFSSSADAIPLFTSVFLELGQCLTHTIALMKYVLNNERSPSSAFDCYDMETQRQRQLAHQANTENK